MNESTYAIDAKWYKLDNAAKIYTSISNPKDSCVFRVAANLMDEVDPATLQQAVNDCKPRFPTMFVKLKDGIFWNYYEHNDKLPKVKPESYYMNQFLDPHKNNGYDFTLFYYKNRISLEVFHSLCDGGSATEFLKAVVFRYFELLGIANDGEGKVLTVDQQPKQIETEDGFKKNYTTARPKRGKSTYAYRIKGTRFMLRKGIGVINGKIPADKLLAVAKQHQATLTQYLAAVLTHCIWISAGADKKKVRKPINICIPVNMRKFYNSQTLRNFSLFFHTSTDCRNNDMSFESILAGIKETFKEEFNQDRLQEILNANVAAERAFAFFPLIIKKALIRIGCIFLGDKLKTLTISNMGTANLPSSLNGYIKDFECQLPVGNESTHSVSVISYLNTISISFTRTIYETDVERLFFKYLAEQGLDIEIETNLAEKFA